MIIKDDLTDMLSHPVTVKMWLSLTPPPWTRKETDRSSFPVLATENASLFLSPQSTSTKEDGKVRFSIKLILCPHGEPCAPWGLLQGPLLP